MRKITNKMKTAAAAASMLAFAAPAFAGGVTVAQNGDSKLKMEGTFYLNTFAEDATNTAGQKTKTVGLHTERAYITLKYYFNDDWYARFTTDMAHEGSLGHKQNVYVKYAYLDGKLAGKAAVLRLGQSHTPWIDHEESIWKHRYVENTLIDKLHLDNSADLGVGLYGDLADNMISYFVTETNGSGYGNGAATNGLDFDSRITIRPIKGLEVDAQFRDGYKGTKSYANNTTSNNVKSTLYQIMASYGTSDFRIGANYINNKDEAKAGTGGSLVSHTHDINGVGSLTTLIAGDQVKTTAYDVWGWINFPGTQFGAFGRYDHVENKGTVNGVVVANKEKIDHYVAGLEYKPTKGVTFSLVADNSKSKNDGGVAGATAKDTRYGLYSQVAF